MAKIKRPGLSAVSVNGNKSVQTYKVCRLCETKDGPFLDIFDAGMDLAKKIDTLLPVTVLEYDDLSHKICFRCSAKLTDLHEFVNKCIETQENLCKSVNKTAPELKTENSRKSKQLWSAKLTKNKISNNMHCEELVKKTLQSLGKNVNDSIKNTNVSGAQATERYISGSKATDLSVFRSKTTVTNITGLKSPNTCESQDKNEIIEKDNINKLSNVKENIKLNDEEEKKPTNYTIQTNFKTRQSTKTLIDENPKKPVADHEVELKVSKNNKDDSDFEKDVRVCISRVGKDGGEDVKKVEKQDTLPKKNVSVFKVAGVGTVYSCEDCSRIFLNKDKMPGHKCITDKSKIMNEIKLTDAQRINHDSKISTTKEIDECKDSKKEPQKAGYTKEIGSEYIKKKIPGPASKTLIKITEKNSSKSLAIKESAINDTSSQSSPSIDAFTIDSILKNLINNQMHYQLVPGPNNTITLQATPQPINIPINLLESKSLSLNPPPTLHQTNSEIPLTPRTRGRNIVGASIPATAPMSTPITTPVSTSSTTPLTLPVADSKNTPSSYARARRHAMSQSQPEPSSTINDTSSNQMPQKAQKQTQVTNSKNRLDQFTPVPVKSTCSSAAPFPVALAKNLYLSDIASEIPSVIIDDSPTHSRDNKRKSSREIMDRSKKAKINPEVIELDDDTEPIAEMDLLEERPNTRARKVNILKTKVGRNKKSSNSNTSQTYRVVPNNNPRKLIISTVASSSSRQTESNSTRHSNGRKSSSKSEATTSRQDENVSFFTHLHEDDATETVIPDKTVLQESQITTTVSGRSTKGRGSSAKESAGTQKCMMCSMSFSDNSKLSAHMKIHYANWI